MTAATFNRSINTHRPPGFFASFGKAFTALFGAFAGSGVEKPSTRALEAAAVRRLADQHRRAAPGFASDLYAAADRHDIDQSR